MTRRSGEDQPRVSLWGAEPNEWRSALGPRAVSLAGVEGAAATVLADVTGRIPDGGDAMDGWPETAAVLSELFLHVQCRARSLGRGQLVVVWRPEGRGAAQSARAAVLGAMLRTMAKALPGARAQLLVVRAARGRASVAAAAAAALELLDGRAVGAQTFQIEVPTPSSGDRG